MAWYVVKRLHVPEGTIKFLERESIKMTQTMQQQQQHKLYLHDYNYVVTVLQKL